MQTETSVKALVFNIQKFSLNDGPGIRTVVFLIGCPLHCKWCANPESQGSPSNPISDEGELKSVDEVFDICLQDLPFYEESGGGVTLSGGEVLMSPDFAVSLINKLKEKHIHVALETTGYASKDIFERVIKRADLLLFDMKHYDEEKHIEGTGVSNAVILENMRSAVDIGLEVLPRIPVIPGFNNSLSDAKGFAYLLKDIGLKKAQLLPFHQFGESKYENLNLMYAYADVPALHREDLEDYLNVFKENGIDAFF